MKPFGMLERGFRAFRLKCLMIGMGVLGSFVSHAHADVTDLQPVIVRTAKAIVKSQLETGLFPYGYDFEKGEELEKGLFSSSNLIRQAGTASSLADYLLDARGPAGTGAVRKTLGFLATHSMPMESPALYSWLNDLGVFRIPFGRRTLQSAFNAVGGLYRPTGAGKVISPDETYRNATAGILALALLTELRYAAATGDHGFAEVRQAWIAALRDLRMDGMGFRGSPESLLDSDYYNGEAWLAFSVLARMHPEGAESGSFLVELDDELMGRYSRYHSRGFYHWGALAASERYMATGDPKFIRYLKGQTDLFFDHLGDYGRNANLCSEMEGMAATLAAFEKAGEGGGIWAATIRDWLNKETKKLKLLQIQEGQTELAQNGQTVGHFPRLQDFAGHFRWGLYKPEFRIDASQHCLSAMLLIQRGSFLR